MVSQKSVFKQVDFDPFSDGEVALTVPSTEAQKEIWISAQFGNEANCAFNESMSFRITGPLKPELFRNCIIMTINRHEALRASFSPDGSILSIASNIHIEIPLIDISTTKAEQLDYLDTLIYEEVTRPFDLTHGPLVRARIVILGEDRYQVLFTAHHIICDGWSMAILIQDLKKTYTSQIKNHEPELSAPVLFSDYALEEHERYEKKEAHADENYWLSLYSQEIPVLDVPTDRPRPAMRSFNADRVDYQLDPEIVRQLKQTGASLGCTFIIILIAAFKTYLYRLTGQQTITLGVPAAGQMAQGKDRLVGHCVNLLPLISKLDPNESFCRYLQEIRDFLFDAYEHQSFTFGSLVKKINLPRDPSRVPLLPVIFNIDQQTADDEMTIEGIDFEVLTNPRQFENFELFLNLSSSALNHQVVIECTYNRNLFAKETIQARLAEFEHLLSVIPDLQEQKIAELPLLPKPEYHRLITGFNRTSMEYPENKCFFNLFEDQAQKHPDRIAVACGNDTITYGNLNSRADTFARYLRDAGVHPGVLVGIFMERSIEMMIALLSILKAGGAYIPLDPDYPRERLEYMLDASRSPILITQEKFSNNLPDSAAQIIFLDSHWPQISKIDATTTQAGNTPGPEDPAYVIFTSGSTGQPKGVQVPHRAVTNFLVAMRKEPGINENDTLLAVTTLSFDIHVLELYVPLIAGAKVVIASREIAADGMQLTALLEKTGASIMQATPSTWRLMIAAGWNASPRLQALCGGEAFPRDLAGQLLERVGSVWNMYGPTETTVWSTCHLLTRKDDPILIGRPIGNTHTYVLDAERQPVPIGVPGELYIGGEGVSLGYLNRQDLTDKAFLPDPFTKKTGALFYKTGDLVKYHADGTLEYLNRLDSQVKVRGFRIEPGEIEAILSDHDAVSQAIVTVHEFGPGDQRLIGYYTKQNTIEVNDGELRNHLRRQLPDYMVPQHFVFLKAFPLTPAGKVNRKVMPLPGNVSKDSSGSSVAPGNSMEKQITGIWQEVLKSNTVGIRDNFFDIGGHSLLAIQVVNRLRNCYGLDLSMAVLFEEPTIELLAKRIQDLQEKKLPGPGNESIPSIADGHEVFEI